MIKIIKSILSVLFLLCLIDMPYGYYQLVRFAGLVGFVILGYKAHQEQQKSESIIYFSLAILFQPFLKIALGREVWNVVDVIVAVGLILSIFLKRKS